MAKRWAPKKSQARAGARLALCAVRNPRRLAGAMARHRPRGASRAQGLEARARPPANCARISTTPHGVIPPSLGPALAALKEKLSAEKPSAGTRKMSEMALEVINAELPTTIGGSADLTRSNLTKTKNIDGVDAGQFRRPLCALRHPRARHGGGDERHGAAWRHHSLFRHVYGVFAIIAAPPIRLAALMGNRVISCDDPRFHRPGRRRTDPSAGRASGRPARHSRSAGDASRRRAWRRRNAGSWRLKNDRRPA